jgi:thiamine pyrophosphokinase
MTTVVIITGGLSIEGELARRLPADAVVIAADSGLDHAFALGLRVDLVVGDLDSVSADALDAAQAAGVAIERFPAEKEQTDLELALERARDWSPGRTLVVSGGGGRLDHLVAGLAVLAAPALTGPATTEAPAVEAWIGTARVVAVQGTSRVVITGCAGEYVSLLPVGGAAHGVVTTGLRYPLHGETLSPTSARGVSNELLGTEGAVTLTEGALLIIQPDAFVTHPDPPGAPT